MEHTNPGGSVKDRICLAMIEAAEARGALVAAGRDRRADERQHRHRPRAGLRGEGLSLHPHDAGEHEPRAAPAPRSVRRRDRAHAGRGADGRRDRARRSEIAAETPGAFMPRAVRQPGEPAVHARDDGARDPRRDGGPLDRRVRRRRRHRRHGERRRAVLRKRAPGVRVVARRAGRVRDDLARRARPDEDPGPRRRLRPEELRRRASSTRCAR